MFNQSLDQITPSNDGKFVPSCASSSKGWASILEGYLTIAVYADHQDSHKNRSVTDMPKVYNVSWVSTRAAMSHIRSNPHVSATYACDSHALELSCWMGSYCIGAYESPDQLISKRIW